MDTGQPAGHDAQYLTVTAQAYGWDTLWGEEGLTVNCGSRIVRAQFTSAGAFVVAVVSGPAEPSAQLSMPQVLDILETHAAPLPPP
ncbi:hypothetical protein ACFV4M_28960 [Kitasatospora indigofera]|uniref:hypothetical protein n=1 Tax=Kitasatospora indigofera TaxID=67307 RepID=UPI003654838C